MKGFLKAQRAAFVAGMREEMRQNGYAAVSGLTDDRHNKTAARLFPFPKTTKPREVTLCGGLTGKPYSVSFANGAFKTVSWSGCVDTFKSASAVLTGLATPYSSLLAALRALEDLQANPTITVEDTEA